VEGYRRAVPHGRFINFAETTPAELLALFETLKARDLVVLVQSTNFRLSEFRIRIELFKRELKTIEHVHLGRLHGDELATYIDALAYDPNYYRPKGRALKERLDRASQVVVECDGTRLTYEGGLEETKLNIGDYREMKNVGGLFPIGEVFTEARDLTKVNGQARIFAFAGDDHLVRRYEPFLVTITDGILTAPDSPAEFQAVLETIKKDEDLLVRELGFGLNPAMGKDRMIPDINAFERQQGVHLSIGAKHAIYAKPGLSRKHGRYHVDIFVDVTDITIDGESVFTNGAFK
jgi:leucyl aminopeptidase (aminopeptidase T)